VTLGGEGPLDLHFSDAAGGKIYDKDGEALAPVRRQLDRRR
jgi:hypothetical protein